MVISSNFSTVTGHLSQNPYKNQGFNLRHLIFFNAFAMMLIERAHFNALST